VYSNLVDADIEWPKIEGSDGEDLTATPSLFYQLLGDKDRRVRRDAAMAIFGTYDKLGNTLASALAGSIHKDVWMARTRGYASTLGMALDSDAIPREVLDNLVAALHSEFPVLHRYIALRKKMLGIDKVHIYDLYVSLADGSAKTYTFDEGWALAMAFWRETFGEEYAQVAARGFEERWIDVYPNKGKRGGAYSWGTYGAHPYLFLNYGETLEDVFTLVHEMGHSVHTFLANKAQPYHLADYSLFVAELASVASESLFYEWLMARTTDKTERLALLSYRINAFVGTFLRQIFFHEFEARAHAAAERGEPLTKETLGKIWGDLWLGYYGADAALDEPYRMGWARVNHFYRRFYVWVYATSFAAGEAIAGRFRAGDTAAVGDYLATLALGGSVYPMDALRRAGVDMTDANVMRTVMVRFSETLDALEAALAE
jgi:oligoendopeptidase F